MTKSRIVASKLVKAFTEHKVKKTYICAQCWFSSKMGNDHHKLWSWLSNFGAWSVYAARDVCPTLPGGSIVKGMEVSMNYYILMDKGDSKSYLKIWENSSWREVVKYADIKKDGILVRAFQPISYEWKNTSNPVTI